MIKPNIAVSKLSSSSAVVPFCFLIVLAAGQRPCKSAVKENNTIQSAAESAPPASRQKDMPLMMPMIAPLLVADSQTSSVLTLVHELQESIIVDVSITDSAGRPVKTFAERIPAHAKKTIPMNERLASLGVTLPFIGSLSVAPHGFVVQLGAQLSYTLNPTGIPAFFEEELVMLNAGANLFRSVALGTAGSPVVVLKA